MLFLRSTLLSVLAPRAPPSALAPPPAAVGLMAETTRDREAQLVSRHIGSEGLVKASADND